MFNSAKMIPVVHRKCTFSKKIRGAPRVPPLVPLVGSGALHVRCDIHVYLLWRKKGHWRTRIKGFLLPSKLIISKAKEAFEGIKAIILNIKWRDCVASMSFLRACVTQG